VLLLSWGKYFHASGRAEMTGMDNTGLILSRRDLDFLL